MDPIPLLIPNPLKNLPIFPTAQTSPSSSSRLGLSRCQWLLPALVPVSPACPRLYFGAAPDCAGQGHIGSTSHLRVGNYYPCYRKIDPAPTYNRKCHKFCRELKLISYCLISQFIAVGNMVSIQFPQISSMRNTRN